MNTTRNQWIDVLQKWPVSKRVNSSRAPDDDPTLIEQLDEVSSAASLKRTAKRM
jgi:hypothetical protein